MPARGGRAILKETCAARTGPWGAASRASPLALRRIARFIHLMGAPQVSGLLSSRQHAGHRSPAPSREVSELSARTTEEGRRVIFSAFPTPQGLYDPATERDACGVAMVADIRGR